MWSSWLPDTGFRSAVTEPKDDMTPRRAAANSRRRTGWAPLDPDSRFARQRTTAIRAGVEIMGRRHREQSAPNTRDVPLPASPVGDPFPNLNGDSEDKRRSAHEGDGH